MELRLLKMQAAAGQRSNGERITELRFLKTGKQAAVRRRSRLERMVNLRSEEMVEQAKESKVSLEGEHAYLRVKNLRNDQVERREIARAMPNWTVLASIHHRTRI